MAQSQRRKNPSNDSASTNPEGPVRKKPKQRDVPDPKDALPEGSTRSRSKTTRGQDLEDKQGKKARDQLEKLQRENRKLIKLLRAKPKATDRTTSGESNDSNSESDEDTLEQLRSVESEDEFGIEPARPSSIISQGTRPPPAEVRQFRRNRDPPRVSVADAVTFREESLTSQAGDTSQLRYTIPPGQIPTNHLAQQPTTSSLLPPAPEASESEPSGSANTSKPDLLPLEWANEASERDRKQASNFKNDIEVLINRAVKTFAVMLLTKNPFPPAELALSWAEDAWKSVCQDAKRYYEDSGPKFNRVIDIIKGRASQVRGKLRNKMVNDAGSAYGLKKGAEGSIKDANMQVIRHLREGRPPRYCYKNPETREGCAQSSIVLTTLQDTYFAQDKDIGVRFKEHFKPLPLPLLALTYTALQYGLDQWENGTQNTKLSFSEDTYAQEYTKHCEWLAEWHGENAEASELIRADMYDRLLDMSDIKPSAAQSLKFSEDSRTAARAELDTYLRDRRGVVN